MYINITFYSLIRRNKVFIYVIGLAVMLGGGTLSLLCGKKSKAASLSGSISLAVSSAVLLTAIVLDFLLHQNSGMEKVFQIPIAVLGLAAAFFSPGYLAGHGEKRSSYYFFFLNLTLTAMFTLTLLKNPFLFLFSWEIMGLASAALVMFDMHSAKTQKAAFLYFVACHAGAAFLIAFFLFPYQSIHFALLALIGFGLKIGFPMLHVWLPEAHPAAPAPVSAIMSGAMIELGFLGLFVFMPNNLPGYFAILLLFLGLLGALWGIIAALAQNNLKRLLAYSSMENMGICSIAFALALLAGQADLPMMRFTALSGAFLHIINHAFLKGGLFLGAGAVLKSCGTLEMDKMGGLMKKAPHTGTLFTLNAAGLSGLPPFNGFISEFLIYYAAFQGVLYGSGFLKALSTTSLIVLALTGGLAAAAMAKTIGGVFLGEPRTKEAAEAKEVTNVMKGSMYFLFILSLVTTGLIPFVFRMLSNPFAENLYRITLRLALFSLLTTLFIFVLLLLQNLFCKGGKRVSPTWDCGYARPDARMQYTPTAFTQPLVTLFAPVLKVVKHLVPPSGIFGKSASYEEKVKDPGMEYFWLALSSVCRKIADKIHFLQSGNLHIYIFIVLLFLAGMLFFAMLKK